MTDSENLKHVLENLFSNAIKYSPLKSHVFISVQVSHNTSTMHNDNRAMMVVSVRDEGCGIALEEQQYLFQKFSRLSSRPTAGESSNGLGLYIAQRLSHLMRGHIWCESEKGKGATFFLALPLAE
jgi:signal transduction histidine kinase